MSSLPYRENVCLLIVNRENLLFLGERANESGVWQFPQGGVEPGSSLQESALREAQEELGVAPHHLQIVQQFRSTHRYDFSSPPPAYAVNRYRGQTQTFWLVRFLGEDSAIALDRHHPIELMSWRWCTPDEIRALAEPKRRPGYEGPLREFEGWLHFQK